MINGRNTPSVGAELSLSFKIGSLSVVRTNADYSYSVEQNSVNSEFLKSGAHNARFGMDISTNFSSKFRADLKSDFKGMFNRTSSGYDYSMYSEYLTLDARWDMLKRVNMTGSYIFHWQHSAVEGKDFVNNVLGFSAGVWLFKNRTARLAINAYDVLGSRNFVSTVMNDRYIQNRYGNVVTNFYTLSFEWKFGNAR